MAAGKVRISKLPEERRQEIMDIAMRVFAEKGYEQTTMRDIAAAVGIVPGLCYRYFESKEDLFHNAVSQYVAEYCTPMIKTMKEYHQSVDELLNRAAALFIERDGKEKYHSFFHKKENRDFNTLMTYAICEYMQPFVKEILDTLNESKILSIPDTISFSQFILYGQIAIIDDDRLSAEEKVERIKRYIKKLME